MIEDLIINKILQEKSLAVLKRNGLEPHLFLTEQAKINFIIEHHRKYDVVPDKTTFLAEFKNFEIVEVGESEEFLSHQLREAYLYKDVVPVLIEVQDIVR